MNLNELDKKFNGRVHFFMGQLGPGPDCPYNDAKKELDYCYRRNLVHKQKIIINQYINIWFITGIVANKRKQVNKKTQKTTNFYKILQKKLMKKFARKRSSKSINLLINF